MIAQEIIFNTYRSLSQLFSKSSQRVSARLIRDRLKQRPLLPVRRVVKAATQDTSQLLFIQRVDVEFEVDVWVVLARVEA